MNYSGRIFAEALRIQLRGGVDIAELARWAYSVYLDHSTEMSDDLRTRVMDIVAMAEGKEFELSPTQLSDMADSLEKQDL